MLKECARIMHLNRKTIEAGKSSADLQHVPFRRSKLTHLLQSCFTQEDHRSCVIGTLSSTPTDIEHSLNTLQHITMMRGGSRRQQAQEESQASDRGQAADS